MNPLMISAPMTHAPNSSVIVALDFNHAQEALHFARRLNPALCQLKIGKELYTASGRSLAESLINQGFKLFLDLKYHDIPHTVAQACKVAAQMGIWMLDIHVLGGRRMMEAAMNALSQFHHRPLLVGVTILTSMETSDLHELGLAGSPNEWVLHLATLAKNSGLDGVVCSPHEAAELRSSLGQKFILVTPGVRLNKVIADDQRRIMLPEEALVAGSDYLVMGRPITQAEDPVAILQKINQIKVG